MQCRKDQRVWWVGISSEFGHNGGYLCLIPGRRLPRKPFVALGALYCIRIRTIQESACGQSLVLAVSLLTLLKILPAKVISEAKLSELLRGWGKY